MRLALAMGRTVRELEESMGADEWADWLLFQSLYDMPDGFIVAGQIGTLVSHVAGGKAGPAVFAPYYAVPSERTAPDPSVGEFFKFVKANGIKKSKPV